MKNCAAYYNISTSAGRSIDCSWDKASSSNQHDRIFSRVVILIILLFPLYERSSAQELEHITLSQSIERGIKNYQSINAKQNYVNAAKDLTRNARNEYLPNVIASVQQNYGTINGQFGPGAPIGVLGVASSGPVSNQQNWNATFGALYILSTNWDVFTFGRIHSRVELGDAQQRQSSADLEQEIFVHQVRIAGAYLNLLIAQQLLESAKSNFDRAQTIQENVRARTLSGLNAGVDSSLANAEVSSAKLMVLNSITNEQAVQRQLSEFLGTNTITFDPDTSLFKRIPETFTTNSVIGQNPQLLFYRERINYANHLTKATQKSIMPGLTVFGVYQARASGFNYTYNPETLNGYSNQYKDGINPSRFNYVAGVSLTWNLISPLKIRHQVSSQRFIAAGYQNEYDQLDNQLKNQLMLSDQKIENALQSAAEAPVQYNAALETYLQKSVMYKNGLATMIDMQQAMYVLNRAETDRRVASINVWLALLIKAAAAGDFSLFLNQAK
jgi:outer membrane protein TolC